MNEQQLYTVSELARELGLPISTVRYYRDVFTGHIPTMGSGRRRLYPQAALVRLRFINQSYAAGRKRDEIEREFLDGGVEEPTAATAVQVHETLASSEYRELVTSLLEGERERRELLWQMVRELSRFGNAIEQQHFVLNELVEQVVQRADRRLPPPAERPRRPHEPDAGIEEQTQLPEGEAAHLRRALANEQELVERLRRSKLELERRAAAAEAELEAQQVKQRGIWDRLFRQSTEG